MKKNICKFCKQKSNVKDKAIIITRSLVNMDDMQIDIMCKPCSDRVISKDKYLESKVILLKDVFESEIGLKIIPVRYISEY